MSGSKDPGIPISQKHGVNPSLVVCIRCGEDTGEIILPGKINRYSCSECGKEKIYLHKSKHGCPDCKKGSATLTHDKSDVEMPRKVSMGTFCKKCEGEIAEHRKAVEDGGIYWECKDCKSKGVITGDAELAKIVRKDMKIEPPKPCGIQFTKEELCPVCGPNKEVYGGKEAPPEKEEGPEGA